MSRRDGQSMKVLKMDIESGKLLIKLHKKLRIIMFILFYCFLYKINETTFIFYFFQFILTTLF